MAELRTIENFPKEGVTFIDISPKLADKDDYKEIIDKMCEFIPEGTDYIVGPESRGYIFAAPVAIKLGIGFIPVRKKGKLPAETLEVSYEKEYGVDTIQIHKDALSEDDVVILHDDILATGGTIQAAIELIKKFNVKKIYVSFIGEIDFLKGRDKIDKDLQVDVLIHF